MCDFQYLPLVTSEDFTSHVCVYNQLVPQGMESADWLNQSAPLYLPPAAFTRMDTAQVIYPPFCCIAVPLSIDTAGSQNDTNKISTYQ